MSACAGLNGDFLSPCVMTALDGGHTMTEAVSRSLVDYVCLGNHEFDLGLVRHLSLAVLLYLSCQFSVTHKCLSCTVC